MTAIEELRIMALEHSRKRSPSMPDAYRVITKYKDNTANGLTTCILDWLHFNGHRADRISSAGRFIEGESVTDVVGRVRQMKGSFIPGQTRKGYADIEATIKPLGSKYAVPVKIEVKQKDKQSDVQKEFQRKEEAAGGIYILVRTFEEFLTEYKKIIAL
jgi:hypothetical protein